MVDLETLDVDSSAVILTIGAVRFDPFSDSPMEELYMRVDIDDQDALGCTVSESTLEWWGQQDPAIMEEAFSLDGRVKLVDAMKQFHSFAWGCDKFWSHGATFDLMMLQDRCKRLNKSPPWSFWDLRDTRTLFDLADPEMPQSSKHHALEDAKRQAIGVRNVYRKIGYTGRR